MEGNLWSKMNEPLIKRIMYKLEELRMRETINNELNIPEMLYLIKGFLKENSDIQMKIRELEEKNKKLEEKIKELSNIV